MPATLLNLGKVTLKIAFNLEEGPLNLEEGPLKLGKGLFNRQDRVRSAQLQLSGSQSGRSRYVGLWLCQSRRCPALMTVLSGLIRLLQIGNRSVSEFGWVPLLSSQIQFVDCLDPFPAKCGLLSATAGYSGPYLGKGEGSWLVTRYPPGKLKVSMERNVGLLLPAFFGFSCLRGLDRESEKNPCLPAK